MWLERLQKHGTLLQRGWNGIQNMPITACTGRIANQSTEIVLSAERGFNLWGKESSVLNSAETNLSAKDTKKSGRVLFAILNFLVLSLMKRKCAVQSVERLNSGPTDVYNLTLERENVYYANGFLVQNCADATFLALHIARMRHGLASNEHAAARALAKTHPSNLLFPPYDFNRKPQQQTRPAMIEINGGWASGIA